MNAIDPDHALGTPAGARSRPTYDVAVIGAGPAGISAALEAERLGLAVVLIDEQPAAGGQIHRAIGDSPFAAPVSERHRRRSILGGTYWRGIVLVERLAKSRIAQRFDSTVWAVERGNGGDTGRSRAPDEPGSRSDDGTQASREAGSRSARVAFDVCLSSHGESSMLRARHLIVATGAQERPFPISGWTLPGVMSGGAAQTLLKSSALVPDVPTVLAGCGPLLYLLAAQYARAGARIEYILDTTPSERWRGLAHAAYEFARSPYFRDGLELLLRARRHPRFIAGVTELRAIGNGGLQHVGFTKNGQNAVVPARLLLLHQGVVPSINLTSALGCAHHWDAVQCCFVPTVDAHGASSVPGVTIAGDAAGVGGARLAALRGALAAVHCARALGIAAAASHIEEQIARWTRGRAFIDRRFRPAPQFRVPSGDTIVCRCEEVTAQQVADCVRQGASGPNQLKAFLRCGMGPCQGRLCALTVTELIAHERGITPAEVGCFRLRFPVKPITLGELASLPSTDVALEAVERIDDEQSQENDR